MHAYLEAREDEGCDRTLRFTEAWARQGGRDVDVIIRAVNELGGYCDCEVLANVTRDELGWPEQPAAATVEPASGP